MKKHPMEKNQKKISLLLSLFQSLMQTRTRQVNLYENNFGDKFVNTVHSVKGETPPCLQNCVKIHKTTCLFRHAKKLWLEIHTHRGAGIGKLGKLTGLP